MYRCMKKEMVKSAASSDDLVLEDAEDGETHAGEGNVPGQRPNSGHIVENTRTVEQKQTYDSGGFTIRNIRDQEESKRVSTKAQYSIEEQKKTPEPNYSASSPAYQLLEEPVSLGNGGFATDDKQPCPETKCIRTPKLDNLTSMKPEEKSIFFDDIKDPMENRVNVSNEELKSSGRNPVKTEGKKLKSRLELLEMLDIRDPNCIGPNIPKRTDESVIVNSQDGSKLGDLELGDLDETDLVDSDLIRSVQANVAVTPQRPSFPIDLKTAQNLKKVIFGTTLQQFNNEWKLQSFNFGDEESVPYGIVQKKGGPCGVLAAVQACCLQELLFGAGYDPKRKKLNPMHADRTEALSRALSAILWRCGQHQSAVLSLPGNREFFTTSSSYKADGLTETCALTKFDDFDELSQSIKTNISLFETDDSPGVILLLYSAILSRTIDGVRTDMDDRDGKLMGQYFYCTQDMVNLLLTGRASSNTFNNVIELGGPDELTILKGLTKRNDIGFLSLFEHFKSCEVGTYYKTPKYPIWVVCCESHFSVLFATKKELVSDWKAERRFDLFYYDGLAGQYEEIMLTVDTTNRFPIQVIDDDMVPPLEKCIRTKWTDAVIEWNGTEPLL